MMKRKPQKPKKPEKKVPKKGVIQTIKDRKAMLDNL